MEVSETNALSVTPGALLPLLTIRTSTAVRNEPDIVAPHPHHCKSSQANLFGVKAAIPNVIGI